MALRFDPDGRRFHVGGTGRLTLVVGLLLALVGGGLTYALLDGGHGVTVNGRPGKPSDAWFPALFLLAGLAVAGLRRRSEVDVARRVRFTRTRWWWWSKETEEPLGEPSHVSLHSERRGSGKNSRVAYPVQLITATGEHELSAPSNELRGRAEAERVARVFQVPLHDRRGGTELVRRPDELDRSAIETARRAEAAQRPAQCRIDVQREGRRVSIRVPSPKSWVLLLAVVPMALPVGFFAFLWLPTVFGQGSGQGFGQGTSLIGWLFWLGIPALICGLPLILIARAAYIGGLTTCRIHIDQGELRIGRRRFSSQDVEEVHVTGDGDFRRHLRIGSDTAQLRLGRGLTTEELTYLRGTILSALAG